MIRNPYYRRTIYLQAGITLLLILLARHFFSEVLLSISFWAVYRCIHILANAAVPSSLRLESEVQQPGLEPERRLEKYQVELCFVGMENAPWRSRYTIATLSVFLFLLWFRLGPQSSFIPPAAGLLGGIFAFLTIIEGQRLVKLWREE